MTDAREHEALDAAMDRLVRGLPPDAPIAAGEGLEPLLQAARAAREAFAVQVPDEVAQRHVAALIGLPTLSRPRRRHRPSRPFFTSRVSAQPN